MQGYLVGNGARDGGNILTGDHNVVIQAFVEGIRRLPTDYATRIGNLLTE